MKSKIIFLSTFFLSVQVHARSWDLNDVSILYPLPQSITEDATMLQARNFGVGGEILPKNIVAYFQEIPVDLKTLYESLRVVSIRIDPCTFVTQPCEPEIRFVIQSVVKGPHVGVRHLGFHTFYRLTQSVFKNFIQQYKNLIRLEAFTTSKGVKRRSLNVHPNFVQHGIDGYFGRELKKLLLQTIGKNSLYRVAAFWNKPENNQFSITYAAREKETRTGQWIEAKIPNTSGSTHQTLKDFGSTETVFSVQFVPEPSINPIILKMTKNSAQFKSSATDRQARIVGQSWYLFQNPHRGTREKINCVLCHMAPNTSLFMEKLFSELNLRSSPYRYRNSSYDLFDNSPFGWGIVAFGYQRTTASIHPRVIAESAETASLMNQMGY